MCSKCVTVILNLVTVLPILGVDLLSCVLGDLVVAYSTLVRIEVVHLPLICLLLLLCHLVLIHRNVSSSVAAVVGVHAYSDGDSMLIILLKDSLLLFVFFYVRLCVLGVISVCYEQRD
jgi:quinol-cytochrome oxidoreductase complex cytochrome b subunit